MDAVSYAHSAKQAKRITNLLRISEAEPTEVELGTEWYVPSSGKTYKRTNDGTNDIWLDVGSGGANAAIKQNEEFVVGTASGNYDGSSLNTFPTTAGYYTDYVLVALNGKILAKDDFTATDGYNVILTEDATNGDVVEVIAFGTFVVADHYTKGEIDAVNSAQDNVVAGKALLGGSSTQTFKVADAVNGDEAVNKSQMDIANNTKLSIADKRTCVAWAVCADDATIQDSYGVDSVVKSDTGKYAITLTDDMADTNYLILGTSIRDDQNRGCTTYAQSVSEAHICTFEASGGGVLDNAFMILIFGDKA